MKKLEKNFRICLVDRGNSSCYGNPRYILWLEDQEGNLYFAKTASNASVAYSISNLWCDTYKTLQYHYTKNGNMIVDRYIKD